jgi:hypothetical protein
VKGEKETWETKREEREERKEGGHVPTSLHFPDDQLRCWEDLRPGILLLLLKIEFASGHPVEEVGSPSW